MYDSNPYPTVWHYISTKNFPTIAILTRRSSSQEHGLGNHHHKKHKHEELCSRSMVKNVHLIEKNRIKESHTVHISSVQQRNNQSLIHKANRRRRKRRTRAKEGRLIDKKTEEKKKREREKYQGKKHKPHGYSALVVQIKLRGEAFTRRRRRRSQRQTFPGRQSRRLGSRDLCCNRDHTGGHGYTHSRHTRHLATPSSVLISFLLTSLATGNGKAKSRAKKRISFF